MKVSTQIVNAILKDLTDRSGLRQEWEGIDEDIKLEIRQEWEQLIEKVLDDCHVVAF